MTHPAPTAENPREDFRGALKKLEALHGNMAVLYRIGVLLRDINTGPEDIARLLQTDGALSANVIRVSNSAFYGCGVKTAGVQDALIKVGYNQILSLLGAALSRQMFMRDLPAYGLTADDYWAYSYFCAVFLEKQAPRLGLPAGDAYMVGLLHGIGRVVINELLLKTHIEVYWDPAIPCEEWEDIIVGFRHDEAGALLLKNWNFGPEIHRRVADQKSARALADDPLLCVLDFARTCAELNHYRVGTPSWRIPPSHPFALLTPDFDPESVSLQVEQARSVCVKIKDSFAA